MPSEKRDASAWDRPPLPGAEREVFGLVGRSGRGGRKRNDYRKQLTEESRKLLVELGEPFEHRTVAGGVIVMRFLVDPHSDSGWFIRLSPTQQDKSQETAMAQLHEMQALHREGLLKPPRWIVITLNNSGGRKPHERYDLLLMLEWIKEGWLRTVVFRNEKRLARQKFTLAWCEEILESAGTDIFFTEYRRCVDWESSNDRMLFTLKGMFAAEDRRTIVQQTQDALDRLYVDEGKGWPALQQIGLRRCPLTGFMIEDEEQTEMILRGARIFVSQSGLRCGLTWMAKEMKEKYGFELSEKQWERVLKNPGFTTGEFFFNRKGRGRVPLRRIDLVNPIPPDLARQIRNAFTTNKGNRRSRTGDFVLLQAGNGQEIPTSERGMICKRCGRKLGAWLQGDLNDTRYRHRSPVPDCCRGWGGPERAEIEAAVMPELWRLAEVQELREAAIRAAAVEETRVSAYLDTDQRRQLQKDIDDIDREIARLGREYRRTYLHNGKAARSKKDHVGAYHDLVAGLKDDRKHLQARLDDADALDVLDLSAPPATGIGLAAALREVLTIDVPDDDAACRRRAAVYGLLVTKAVIDKRKDGEWDVELHGPLIPKDLPLLSVPAPLDVVRTQLITYQAEQARPTGNDAKVPTLFGDAQADLATRPELQVSSQAEPYDETCNSRPAWIHRFTTGTARDKPSEQRPAA